MKVKVFRDYFISMYGVELIWTWKCPHSKCRGKTYEFAFWENALRSARQHVDWHQIAKV